MMGVLTQPDEARGPGGQLAGPSAERQAATNAPTPPVANTTRWWVPWPFQRPFKPLPGGLMIHVIAGYVSVAGQLVVTISMWNRASSTAAQWQTALLVLVKLAAAYGTMLAPEAYWRRRNIFAPMIRFGFHLLPVVREQGVGAGLVLETAARPGVRGAIQDLARLLGGMRQLGAMVGGLALLLPPAVTLCTQSILLLLVSNTETYCKRPLLEDPLTQQRLSGLATGLEYATLPVLVLQPLVSVESPRAAALLLGEASASSVCRVTLSFIQVAVVVLLPTLVAVYFWEGPQAEQEEAAERAALRAAASSQPTAAAAAGAAAGTPAARGWWQGWRGAWYRLMDSADQVAAAANRALYCALHSPKLVDSRTLAVPWLLATLWWLCKCSEGLH